MLPIRDNIPSKRFPFVTYLLIVANVLLFIYQSSLGEEIELFIRTYGCIPYEVIRGRGLFSLFSSMFLHGSWVHLLGNMLFLFIFGDNIEDFWGHRRYFFVYILFGLIAAGLQILVSRNSTIPFIGASGAVAGVMGGYLFLYPYAKINVIFVFFFFIRVVWISAFMFLGFWILLQIVQGVLTPPSVSGIAFFAHIGGFFGGLFITSFSVKRRLRGWRM